jgi:hypothetical protein
MPCWRAGTHAATARIFTFGIGGCESSSRQRLARAWRGSEFIFPGERIGRKSCVRSTTAVAGVDECQRQWGRGRWKPATSAIPPIFSGSRLLVCALGASAAASTDRLSADGPNGPCRSTSRWMRATRPTDAPSRRRGARAEFASWKSPEWLGLRGSRQTGRKTSAAGREIALATRYRPCRVKHPSSRSSGETPVEAR